jgi:TonB family protein
MRHFLALALLLLTLSAPVLSQQSQSGSQPVQEKIVLPVLLPVRVAVSAPDHCEEFNGVVKFRADIDTAGIPHALKPLAASDERLVTFAARLLEAQRFEPGTVGGSPAELSVELTAGLHTCAQRVAQPTDGNFYRFTLHAHPLVAVSLSSAVATLEEASATSAEIPVEKIGGRVSAPEPIQLPDPKAPITGKLPKRGLCVLAFTVDDGGVTRDVHVVRPLDPELDGYAIEAIKNWRFRPALRDGREPVAVTATAAAEFEYLGGEAFGFASFIPEAAEAVHVVKLKDANRHPLVVPVNADEVIARFKPQSRVSGNVYVSLLIDPSGVPRNVHVVKGLDSSLNMETAMMIEQLRFAPAAGAPVSPCSIRIVIPIHYRAMVEKPTWRALFADGLSLAILAL